ncbi:MAG: hypothetical protein IT219_11395 [Bacteroidales bacterium]|jgi:hypothetical protein|nr:hypothetical protein [Bacteroidales bacterium]
MELLLIIFTTLVIVAFTILSFYTSVNKGAEHFEQWISKWLNNKNK